MGNPKIGMNTSLGQFQTLRMTPQLQQAIKLLQLSRMEFETAIQKELEENPILEEVQDAPEDGATPAGEGETPVMDAQPPSAEVPTGDAPVADQTGQDPTKQDEFEWDSYLDQPSKPREHLGSGNEEIMNYENMISASQSLYDHLLWQMNLSGFNDEEKHLGEILIQYIDEEGYLKTPLEQISQDEQIPLQDLVETLPLIQELDPPGVGAATLTECLLIQAKHLGEDTNDIIHLINHHLKDLEKKNYDGIAKAMGKTLEDVIEMSKVILEMDPKPGRAYMPNETMYVTPDVYVYKVGEEYVVSLNEDGLPRLRVSNFYKSALKVEKTDSNKGAQDYIKDKLKSALFLIKSIHQRQRTIYRVTESIVKHQRDFFDKGPAFIRPMILRDIANDIGIHESTVSRVTSNKYMHTPRGIFELKYFFNSGISTSSGESMASESVKLRIKELIIKENVKDPLSDQKIVEILSAEGVQIARRTVAKYRDALGVLPSSKRKKFF